ncbi:MAG: sensor histidine kinase [Erysipelotrichaceae bacterium]
MDKYKVKWRIFGFLIGFCTLLLAILWLFRTVLLPHMYKLVRTAEMEQAIVRVEEHLEQADLQSVINELAQNKDIMVLPSVEFTPPVRPNQSSGRRPIETITKTKEFVLSNGQVLSLTFHAMITPVDATLSTLQLQLYIITAIMIFFAVVFAIVISRHISRPIEQLNQSAKVLGRGDYEVPFAGHGYLEIKELSDTLNAAAKELGKVERVRKELVANVSHDLRTPLALIYSYAEMMHDFPDEITQEQTQIIMEESKRLSMLVNEVLELSSLEQSNMELRLEAYNLTTRLQAIIANTAQLVQPQGYQIAFEYTVEAMVKADPVKIDQAFYNILTNAIHYSDQDKPIVVRQKIEQGKVIIEVEDHGEGIAEEELPYIWERYYRVDKNHKRAIAGTGLGLSIVKKIVDAHKGHYGVESSLNEGSRFWFSLPLE